MRAKPKSGSKSKPKSQTSKGTTLVTFVLDRSGSMTSCRDATVSAFNEFKQDTAKNAPGKVLFSLTTFNTDVTIEHQAKPIAEIPDLDGSYLPGGCTALYDAIGQTIRNLEAKLKAEAIEPSKNLFVILTDGQENSSIEYHRQKTFDLIKQKTAEGWTFVFMGANQDAYAEAGQIGIPMGNVTSYVATPAGTHDAVRATACSASAFYSSGARATSSFYDRGVRPSIPPGVSVTMPKMPPMTVIPAVPLPNTVIIGKATPTPPVQATTLRRRWDDKL